jgi:hypothetical protein
MYSTKSAAKHISSSVFPYFPFNASTVLVFIRRTAFHVIDTTTRSIIIDTYVVYLRLLFRKRRITKNSPSSEELSKE